MRVLVAFVFAVLGAAVGLLVGADYGGNVAPSAEFGGLRGYEAYGQWGALVGFAAGWFVGLLAGHFAARSSEKPHR